MPSALSSLEPVRGLGFREISPIAKVQWLLHLGLKKLLNLLGLQPINHSPPHKKNSYPISPKWICMTLEFATKNVCLRTFSNERKKPEKESATSIHPGNPSTFGAILLTTRFRRSSWRRSVLKKKRIPGSLPKFPGRMDPMEMAYRPMNDDKIRQVVTVKWRNGVLLPI